MKHTIEPSFEKKWMAYIIRETLTRAANKGQSYQVDAFQNDTPHSSDQQNEIEAE